VMSVGTVALQRLSACECWSGAETGPDALEKARLILLEWFWMVEASAPELFSATRRKFGEVLLRADLAVPKPMDFSLLLALRLPRQFSTSKARRFNASRAGLLHMSRCFSFQRFVAGELEGD